MYAKNIVNMAKSQIGTTAVPVNNILYNTAYYGGPVNGSQFDWCAVFIWWCFKQCDASNLYFGGNKTAYCPTLLNYHTDDIISISAIQPGDIVFFDWDNNHIPNHVGIVCESEKNEDKYLTVEGNVDSKVKQCTRYKSKTMSAYHPNYQEENTVDYEQFKIFMNKYISDLQMLPPSEWSVQFMSKAAQLGLIENQMPQSLCTRQETVTMIIKALTLLYSGLKDTLKM